MGLLIEAGVLSGRTAIPGKYSCPRFAIIGGSLLEASPSRRERRGRAEPTLSFPTAPALPELPGAGVRSGREAAAVGHERRCRSASSGWQSAAPHLWPKRQTDLGSQGAGVDLLRAANLAKDRRFNNFPTS